MGFYEQKIRASQEIDKMILANVPLEEIFYKIETTYGFGKKIVLARKERIELIAERAHKARMEKEASVNIQDKKPSKKKKAR